MNPADWFEMTLTISVNLSVYIKVGIFAGFIEVVLYEKTWDFTIVILGPLKISPKLATKVAEMNTETGVMSAVLGTDQLTCESKRGAGSTVSNEEIQCWESEEDKDMPNIVSYENVKTVELTCSSSNQRLQG